MICEPTAGLAFTFPQTYVNEQLGSLGMTCDQHLVSTAVIDFLERNYRYKSIANQIPHDAGLATVPYTGRKYSILEIEPASYPVVRVQSSTPQTS